MSINAHNSGQPSQSSQAVHPASAAGETKSYEVVRPRAVKIAQAALMLALSEKTVRRLIDRGRLRRVQGIRHVLIPLDQIDRFLAG